MIFLVYLTIFIFTLANTEGKQLAVYWGSNSGYRAGKVESRLQEYCKRGTFDTVILTTLSSNSKHTNKDDLPSLTFANHCNDNPLMDYNVYLKCPTIENDIAYCQKKGIKVLLDIGGSSGWMGFISKVGAEQFAEQIWNLYLGGTTSYEKTFGSVVLDGINLSMRVSQKIHQIDFVRKMRQLMDDNQNTKQYLLTSSPNCLVTYTGYLNEAYEDLTSAFDRFYVNFAQPICTLNNINKFETSLQKWLAYALKENGPDIHVGLSASNIFNNSNFVEPDTLNTAFKYISGKYPKIKGIILQDASWDDQKLIRGKRYSVYTKAILTGTYTGLPATTKSTTTDSKNVGGGGGGGKILIFGNSGTLLTQSLLCILSMALSSVLVT